MAYFAKVDKLTKIVLQVHSVSNSDLLPEYGSEEIAGQMFLCLLYSDTDWIDSVLFLQTSYNADNNPNPFRGKYAAIGDLYNSELDIFETPQANDEQE